MISMKVNLFSNVLSMNMDVRVLLPDDVNRNESLKILWLCHGGSGDENEWMYYSTVARIPDEKHIGIVIVTACDSCFVDMANGLPYSTYLGEELPQILRNMFPYFSTKREDNMISGLSNGGYGCFMIGMKYPETFGFIGAFSAGDKADSKYTPSFPGEMTPRIRMFGQDDIHDTEYSMKYVAKELAKTERVKPRVYHACGSEDPWLSMNLLVKECMEEINLSEFHYEYDQIEGLGHEWDFWDEEVRRFLDYALVRQAYE